jgi:hypothetical protein
MSSKPETTFYSGIHKHLSPEVYRMKLNNPFIGGVPDCWYSGKSGDMWIEYKFVVLPKRDDTLIKIELSELQKEWLTHRFFEGRNVGVIVGCKEGGVVLSDWLTPIRTDEFRKQLLTRKELAWAIEAVCL